jgi:hypothetical protein
MTTTALLFQWKEEPTQYSLKLLEVNSQPPSLLKNVMGFSKCLVISERFQKHQRLKIWHEGKTTMYIYCNNKNNNIR